MLGWFAGPPEQGLKAGELRRPRLGLGTTADSAKKFSASGYLYLAEEQVLRDTEERERERGHGENCLMQLPQRSRRNSAEPPNSQGTAVCNELAEHRVNLFPSRQKVALLHASARSKGNYFHLSILSLGISVNLLVCLVFNHF